MTTKTQQTVSAIAKALQHNTEHFMADKVGHLEFGRLQTDLWNIALSAGVMEKVSAVLRDAEKRAASSAGVA